MSWRKNRAPIGVVQPWSGARPNGGRRAGLAIDLVAAESARFTAESGAILLHPGSAGWRLVARAANATGIRALSPSLRTAQLGLCRALDWRAKVRSSDPRSVRRHPCRIFRPYEEWLTVSRAVRISCNTRFISSSTEVSRVGLSKVICAVLQETDTIANVEDMRVVVRYKNDQILHPFL